MVRVEHLFSALDVALDLGPVLPGHRQQPVEIVAHDRRLGRHRAHAAQLLQFGDRLVARLLGELRLVDPILELGHLVATVLAFAELLLDRLQLLVQVVLALGFLHLALDAIANPLFDLKDPDFALHVPEHFLETLGHRPRFEQLLLLGYLQGQMRRDRIGQLAGLFDLIDRDQNLRRDLFVELDVLLELRHHGARQCLGLLLLTGIFRDRLGNRLEEFGVIGKFHDAGALTALDQHLDGAVGQLEELQHGTDSANRIDVRGRRIVLGGILLSDEQNLLVVLHHVFERPHRLLAADKQRHDHVRKHDDVA